MSPAPAHDEPDDAGDDHAVPADLLEIYEILEWEAALAAPKEG